MFEKIRNVLVLAIMLCLVVIPVQAAPVQYADQISDSWIGFWNFLDDLVASVWSNSEAEEDSSTPVDPPPGNDPPSSGDAEDGSNGGDDGAGGPEHGPLPDPIG